MTSKPSNLFIICMLGALSVVSPFAIDMYLPAYLNVAADFRVPTSLVTLTISSYFIGLAGGQVVWGPLLDRFGRKLPLCIGLLIFMMASIGCVMAPNIEVLIILRFIQALGGCSTEVASLAMVRDFFPVDKTAKIISLLFLFIAISPLVAPSTGGFIALVYGWRVIFIVLTVIIGIILALTWWRLPETHQPDASISLKPWPIILEYVAILKRPRFATYALAGAFSFAGFFAFIAGAPIIFIQGFHLSAHQFAGVFAILTLGFIGGSQLNVLLLRKFSGRSLFLTMLTAQVIISLVFAVGSGSDLVDLHTSVFFFFLLLACCGIIYPNAAAEAMSLFTKNAGSAAALLGFLQLGAGALISASISASTSQSSFSIILILAGTSLLALLIVIFGGEKAALDTKVEII